MKTETKVVAIGLSLLTAIMCYSATLHSPKGLEQALSTRVRMRNGTIKRVPRLNLTRAVVQPPNTNLFYLTLCANSNWVACSNPFVIPVGRIPFIYDVTNFFYQGTNCYNISNLHYGITYYLGMSTLCDWPCDTNVVWPPIANNYVWVGVPGKWSGITLTNPAGQRFYRLTNNTLLSASTPKGPWSNAASLPAGWTTNGDRPRLQIVASNDWSWISKLQHPQ